MKAITYLIQNQQTILTDFSLFAGHVVLYFLFAVIFAVLLFTFLLLITCTFLRFFRRLKFDHIHFFDTVRRFFSRLTRRECFYDNVERVDFSDRPDFDSGDSFSDGPFHHN